VWRVDSLIFDDEDIVATPLRDPPLGIQDYGFVASLDVSLDLGQDVVQIVEALDVWRQGIWRVAADGDADCVRPTS